VALKKEQLKQQMGKSGGEAVVKDNRWRIKSKNELRYYILSDLMSNNITKLSIKQKLFDKKIAFQIIMRKLSYYKYKSNKHFINKIMYIYYRMKYKRLSYLLGFSIDPDTFGPGLSIAHYGSIVVNRNVRVGKNCRIHSCVNIGEGNKKNPIIGDNVYIGPGAKIFGKIKIGNNVAIGANAVVNNDVPDNVTVGGVPAKSISHKDSSKLIIKGAEMR